MRTDLFSCFPLRVARVHEVHGPGSFGFAAVSAASSEGTVLWVREAWCPEAVTPAGLAPFFDPGRVLLASSQNQTDSLAVAEEALKAGAVACVVIEITQPLGLREGRRLQLAAKAGHTTGLCITPEGMGSNASESRWHAAPVFDAAGGDSTFMRWEIKKNKTGTIGAWHVRWSPETHRLHVVSPVGERPGLAGAAG
ncbi:ImuA family protein [Roseibium suaedae]|uniref:Protein ImuA n=1 Tax=Roseibium suaedae TaxID=735517 RepID=A0A1M7F036_9HYPH|nr:hypothetical protein [Roseibium suaedae]SHL97341.1 protein ImuA [Roseibium suaedae]